VRRENGQSFVSEVESVIWYDMMRVYREASAKRCSSDRQGSSFVRFSLIFTEILVITQIHVSSFPIYSFTPSFIVT